MDGKPNLAVRNIAAGDHRRGERQSLAEVTVDVQRNFWQLKNTINTMVDQLNSFASEVTRVAAKWVPTENSAVRQR
jgi:hypothetical protein